MVAVVALVGGGGATTAVVLGASMMLLQFSIGTLNDIVDAPRDAGLKPDKPIPAGLVGLRSARVIAAGSATAGLALALTGGPALVAVAGLVLAIGAWYDLRAKGTTLSVVAPRRGDPAPAGVRLVRGDGRAPGCSW